MNLNAAYFPAVELLSALVTVEILVIGGFEAINGHTSTGVVFAFIAALNNFFDPIQQLSQLYTTYQSGMAALDKIFELLDEQPDLVDAPDAVELPPIRGELRFEDVSFRYGARSGDEQRLRAARRRPGDSAGPDGRAGRRDRRRQVDVRQAGGALLRPDRGARAGRRPRPARRHRALAALADGHRPPGGVPVQRHDPREHRLRPAGRDRRGDPRRGARGRRRLVHRGARRRLRHPDRRARRAAVGRPAAARRVCPRAGGRPPDPGPRRGHLERRRAHRDA